MYASSEKPVEIFERTPGQEGMTDIYVTTRGADFPWALPDFAQHHVFPAYPRHYLI